MGLLLARAVFRRLQSLTTSCLRSVKKCIYLLINRVWNDNNRKSAMHYIKHTAPPTLMHVYYVLCTRFANIYF